MAHGYESPALQIPQVLTPSDSFTQALQDQDREMRLSDVPSRMHPVPISSAVTTLPCRPLDSETVQVRPPSPEEDDIKEGTTEDLDGYIPVGVLNRRVVNGAFGVVRDEYPETEVQRLESSRWILTTTLKNERYPVWNSIRIYVLPDDVARGTVPRTSTALRKALRLVMSKVDSSPEAWQGLFNPMSPVAADPKSEEESLFYIFNTLESPKPNIGRVSDPYARRAMKDILDNGPGNIDVSANKTGVFGLKTSLYAYQQRSAAMMIQRESNPGLTLDPRLQPLHGPTGQEYFYDKEEGSILLEKRLYSEPCGGILAETMGYGKTLICLATILGTKGHFPGIPTGYMADTYPVRKETGSLVEMAAAAAGRFSLPWGTHFARLERAGLHHDKCKVACEKNRGAYTIPPPPQRYKSREGASSRMRPNHLVLSSGTLLIVPSNLIDHWKHELRTHTYGLEVLVLRNPHDKIPSSNELLRYDVILFSKTRFEKEAKGDDGGHLRHRGNNYESPLKNIHWLRIIVDEGHNFAGHGQKTSSVHMLEMLHVERRWVVSGTPSNGLYGVEVSLASQDTEAAQDDSTNTSMTLESRRKAGNLVDEELKNLDKLRLIVVDFLNTKPWANTRSDDPANWGKYIKPVGADGKRKKTPHLRSTLQSLVVRHRLIEIENDITLPKLHNKVVYLEPSYFDKTSLNLFIFILTLNAITSERTDSDYMFHSKNRKHLSLLISNLRHAGFWWAGFERSDLEASIKHAGEYLEKNEGRISDTDRTVLRDGILIAQTAINSPSWNSFNQLAELGVFVQDFPEHARGIWSLDSQQQHQEPLLLGISQARQAQKFVTSRLLSADPAEGIAGAGIKIQRTMRESRERSQPSGSGTQRIEIGAKKPVDNLVHRPEPDRSSPKKSSSKKTFLKGYSKSLPEESALSKTKFVGTASAKLTYLLQRVLDLHVEEKIIIFYENNNFAYWIAEGLELLGIEFRIYANTLKAGQRSEYLALFNERENIRVLLMDLRQAAHGLHIACASRVFIVNPIWKPTIESQAIKRAHRISQKWPVFVETLVLRGTFEDKMLRRRKQMTNAELQHAEKDLLDDKTMNFIIQNMGFVQTSEDDPSKRPAYLREPPGFFDRHTLPIADNHADTASPKGKKQLLTPPAASKRKAMFEMPSPNSDTISGSGSGSTFDEPAAKRKRVTMPEFLFESDGTETTSTSTSNGNGNSDTEMSDMPPISHGLPTVTSLFGGPLHLVGFGRHSPSLTGE